MTTVGSRFLLGVVCLCGAGAKVSAATLHGRVKDQRCLVLSQVTVRIHSAQSGLDRTLTTDDGGNYTVDLPPGEYQVCVQSGVHQQPTCTGVAVVSKGDVWITTQLRDAVPDLSNLGNQSR